MKENAKRSGVIQNAENIAEEKKTPKSWAVLKIEGVRPTVIIRSQCSFCVTIPVIVLFSWVCSSMKNYYRHLKFSFRHL